MIQAEGRQLLVQFLAGEFKGYVNEEVYPPVDIAEAIASFLEIEGVGDPWPSDLIALTGARCLAGLGFREEGLAFLKRHVASESMLELYSEFLVVRPFSYRDWTLLDNQVLTLDATAVTQRPSYALHVSRIPMQESDLELTAFKTIRVLLESFAGLWQSRGGRFHLGIKGLPAKKGRSKKLPSSREILDFCRDWFDREAESGAWPERPDVTIQDLGSV